MKIFGIGLSISAIALAALWYITNHLPSPYQRYQPLSTAGQTEAFIQDNAQ